MYRLLLNSLYFGIVCSYNQYSGSSSNCDDLSPYYGDLKLDEITGTWYGVEKVFHSKGEYTIENTNECFSIDIKGIQSEPTASMPYPPLTNSPYMSRTYSTYGLPEQHRTLYFVLEWHEGVYQEDYHVKVNTEHKGFWQADLPNGWVNPEYRHFGTVIQVLSVANTYLVLNFCLKLPSPKFYSVILSRYEHQLRPEDLAAIHNVFTLKHLSTSSLKRVCGNSATASRLSSFILIVTWILVCKFR